MASREQEIAFHRANIDHSLGAVLSERDEAKRRQWLEAIVDEIVILNRLVEGRGGPAPLARAAGPSHRAAPPRQLRIGGRRP